MNGYTIMNVSGTLDRWHVLSISDFCFVWTAGSPIADEKKKKQKIFVVESEGLFVIIFFTKINWQDDTRYTHNVVTYLELENASK